MFCYKNLTLGKDLFFCQSSPSGISMEQHCCHFWGPRFQWSLEKYIKIYCFMSSTLMSKWESQRYSLPLRNEWRTCVRKHDFSVSHFPRTSQQALFNLFIWGAQKMIVIWLPCRFQRGIQEKVNFYWGMHKFWIKCKKLFIKLFLFKEPDGGYELMLLKE